MNLLHEFLRHHHSRPEIAALGLPEPLSTLLITPRFRASRHVLFLLFPPGRAEPCLVAKVPRLPGDGARLAREAALLAAAARQHPCPGALPQLIACEEWRGTPILLESALVGEPLDPAAVRHDPAGACEAVFGWLAGLEGRPPSTGDAAWQTRHFDAPLEELACHVPLAPDEQTLLARTEALLAPLRPLPLPRCFEHGDLSHPNILRLEAGGIGVVDWEMADPEGVPLCDWLFFLFYVATARHRARKSGDFLAAFDAAFFGPDSWALPWVRRYAERAGVPDGALTPLFILCWLRYAVGLLRRLDEEAQGPLPAERVAWLRQNRFYRLWHHAVSQHQRLAWEQ